MVEEGGVESLLDERPDLESALESALAVDESNDTWTFEDIPVDSGPFGELVSRGVVESDGEAYRLADPDAVRTALQSEPSTTAEEHKTIDLPSMGLPAVDRLTATLVAGAILALALVRTALPLGAVYRDGDVVLSGNDPYYYRYWVEQVVAGRATPLDFGSLDALPPAVTAGEPLPVATLWWVAELLGFGASSVGHVLAWYPVVSAVVTAAFVYVLSVKLTADRRVGVAAVLLLAILPGHALRTSLGFADHHAFDYPWLAATALLLVILAAVDRDTLTRPKTILASLGLGLTVTAQVLAWEAGPLLIAPIGLVVAGRALVDVRGDRAPWIAGVPVAGGLAIAATLTWLVHDAVGWHTDVVASAPALLLCGVLGAIGVATAVHRSTGDVRHLAIADAVALVGVVALVAVGLPAAWATLLDRLEFLFASHAIVETHSLFSPTSLDFLFLFGFTLLLALPMMAVALRDAATDGRWLVATGYAWYFLGLAAVQVRFVGELAAFAAVFAGLGFVKLAAWADIASPLDRSDGAASTAGRTRDALEPLRLPDRRTLGALFVLFLLLGSFGGLQTAIKTGQITTSDATYETAAEIRAHETALDREYPDNYVLSRWGQNRVYNYFVNGEAKSYSYAEQTYEPFITAEDPDGWYGQLQNRVGYIVIEDQDSPPESMHARLFDAYSSQQAQADVEGLHHYRVIFVHESGDRAAFELVPGSRLRGVAVANATVSITTNVSVPGETFTYEQQTTAKPDGRYAFRLPYPGEYRIRYEDEERTVTVPESAIMNDTNIAIGSG